MTRPSLDGNAHVYEPVFATGRGFPKGTLVHTPNGPIAIDRLRPGDLVLAKVPQTGASEPRPVVKSIARPATEVARLLFCREHDPSNASSVDITLDHPFHVTGQGWTHGRRLFSGFGEQRFLELVNGDRMIADCVKLVFRTSRPGVGWISYVANASDECGYEFDFDSGTARMDVYLEEDFAAEWPDSPRVELPVFDLEVKDGHSYFVGVEGVLVADATIEIAPDDHKIKDDG